MSNTKPHRGGQRVIHERTKASPAVHAADRLLQGIKQKRAPVCVGIDPVLEKLPRAIQPRGSAASAGAAVIALDSYCRKLLDTVAPFVPCVKFQSACFERYGPPAIDVLNSLIQHASSSCGLQVILDSKRGDIGVSAEHYAAAAFNSLEISRPDWLTINSYLGEDGISPFLQRRHGAFALVRTSNPGGDEVQNLVLKDGRTVAHAMGEMIARIGQNHPGKSGYSALGAVVGATKREDAAKLRHIMPQQIFLVPGYGAQGATIDDVLPCFNSDGQGAIVTASRSVIYAFKADDPSWTHAVAEAAAKFADDVGKAVGMR